MKVLTLTVSVKSSVITPVSALNVNATSLGRVVSWINMSTLNASVSNMADTVLFAMSVIR